MSTLTARDKFKKDLEDGGDQIVLEYFKRLSTEEASIDDLRKGVELVAKAHGLNQPDKQDSLMQVSWTITGGNVTIGVTKPETKPEDADVTDVEAKEPAVLPDVPTTMQLEVVDNLLENI